MVLKSNTLLNYCRYSIISCIGDGGFGITYLARDNKLEREVVLKEYFPDYMAKRDTNESNIVKAIDESYQGELHIGINKIMREAKILALLDDIPAIATVHDFFEENNTAYIVMEYIKGKTLKQCIKERTVPYSFLEALSILEPCMLALQRVHEAGIIHRDFAPDNIIINDKNQVKIIDFGSSREYIANNATMTVMVKHGYAPLEQYSNAVKQGPYTDVYSLGAILYEMLTLNKPMPSIDRVIFDNLMAPSAVNPAVLPVQDAVVMRALSIVFSSRYQTVKDFHDALKEVEKQNEVKSSIIQTSNNSGWKDVINKKSWLKDSEATEVMGDISQQLYSQELVAPKRKSKIFAIIGAACAIAVVLVIVGIGSYIAISESNFSKTTEEEKIITTNVIKDTNNKKEGDYKGESQKESQKESQEEAKVEPQDAKEALEEDKPMEKSKKANIIPNVSVGDTFTFGNYNGNTEWIVLAKEDRKMLVISKYAIENRTYNAWNDSVTWEICSLRGWLNETYFESAFSSDEQELIIETSINNPDNDIFGSNGGNNTTDKVFLLSIDEVYKYFASESSRKATSNDGMPVWWWLRSPGNNGVYTAAVKPDGSVHESGVVVGNDEGLGDVRPVMWLDISDN